MSELAGAYFDRRFAMPACFVRIIYITLFCTLACNTVSYAEDDPDAYLRHKGQLLIEAIRKNDFNKFYELIQIGADVNRSEEIGTGLLNFLSIPMTPLEKAVSMENELFIRILLETGADVNAQNDNGETVLMEAISSHSSPAVVQMLLEAGADPNARNGENGQVALMRAIGRIFWNNTSAIEALLEAGADINIQDVNGNTALMVLSRRLIPSPHITETLLKAGADPYKKNKYGQTALEIAKNIRFASTSFFGGIFFGGILVLGFARQSLGDLGLLSISIISAMNFMTFISTYQVFNSYSNVVSILEEYDEQKQQASVQTNKCIDALSE